jgi:hypothetical protein
MTAKSVAAYVVIRRASINTYVRITIRRKENEADEAYLSTYYEHFYRNIHLANNTAICGTKILAQSLLPYGLEVRLM